MLPQQMYREQFESGKINLKKLSLHSLEGEVARSTKGYCLFLTTFVAKQADVQLIFNFVITHGWFLNIGFTNKMLCVLAAPLLD